MRLILASTSPRRRALLTLLGLPFDVSAPTIAESVPPGVTPEAQARSLAEQKAHSCAPHHPDGLMLGSDTLIALEGAMIGKPADTAEAADLLRRLRGRRHVIYTAVAVGSSRQSRFETAVEVVGVWMRPFSEAELAAYVSSGEGLDKAGAYAIQGDGAELVERVEGDYTAVVGLPLRLVAALLARHGMSSPVDIERLYREKPFPNWSRFAAP